MAEYSKRELEHAADFRKQIHAEALEKVKAVRPDIRSVVDRYPVEAYFQQVWDYPGKWYTAVAVPEEAGSRIMPPPLNSLPPSRCRNPWTRRRR